MLAKAKNREQRKTTKNSEKKNTYKPCFVNNEIKQYIWISYDTYKKHMLYKYKNLHMTSIFFKIVFSIA